MIIIKQIIISEVLTLINKNLNLGLTKQTLRPFNFK
jgi:hypothetical protein